MKKRSDMSAAQFLAELRDDPDVVARQQASEEVQASRARDVTRILKPVVEDLSREGYVLLDLNDLVKRYAPLPANVVDILLLWLPRVADVAVKEQIVRSLGASAVPFPGVELISAFEATDSEALRWAIANTIAEATPLGLEQWLARALSNQDYGRAREMLLIAAARILSASEAIALIVPLLSQMPLHVVRSLAEIGGSQELVAFEERLATAKGLERKELERAIRKIRTRLR